LPLRGKILNVEKPCIIKYLKTKRSKYIYCSELQLVQRTVKL
jgi:DNA gyrase/topoisomerase IV subunit B